MNQHNWQSHDNGIIKNVSKYYSGQWMCMSYNCKCGISESHWNIQNKPTIKLINLFPRIYSRKLHKIIQEEGVTLTQMPININRNQKGVAFVTFENKQLADSLIGKIFNIYNYATTILHPTVKTCLVCKSVEHLVKECFLVKERNEQCQKQQENLNKFRKLYNKYQSKIYQRLQKQFEFKGNEYINAVKQRKPTPKRNSVALTLNNSKHAIYNNPTIEIET